MSDYLAEINIIGCLFERDDLVSFVDGQIDLAVLYCFGIDKVDMIIYSPISYPYLLGLTLLTT